MSESKKPMNDRLTKFLYVLVRDHVPIGVINQIIVEHMPHAFHQVSISCSDHLLEAWAREAANRIQGIQEEKQEPWKEEWLEPSQ